ncbi:MAG: DUF4258 domain-containing protein [Nitrospinae bacterium]|nr:DUF4258 domain-containing protein [Nitrospinota bacterium]
MSYELSQHALDVLQERGISVEWVERVVSRPVLTKPDPVDSALEHQLGEIAEFDNRVLRVIVNVQVNPVRVVTAYFDRKMKGVL